MYVCLLRQLSQTLNGECIHFWVEQKRTSRRSSTWKPPSLRRKRLQGRVWMWPKPLLDWPRARPYPWEKIKGRENLQAGNTTQRCRWVLFLSSKTELGQSRNLSFLKLLILQIESAFYEVYEFAQIRILIETTNLQLILPFLKSGAIFFRWGDSWLVWCNIEFPSELELGTAKIFNTLDPVDSFFSLWLKMYLIHENSSFAKYRVSRLLPYSAFLLFFKDYYPCILLKMHIA